MHPEVPREDMPVTELLIDGLISTGGAVISGNSACNVILRGIRHPGDTSVVSLQGYQDTLGGRFACPTESRVLLADSIFGEKGAVLCFSGSNVTARVKVSGCLSDGPIRVVTAKGAKVEEVR